MDYIVEIKRENSTTVKVNDNGKIEAISPFYERFLGKPFLELEEELKHLKPKIRKL
jgi:Holliday junction resolvase